MAEYIEKQAAIDALMEILDRPNHAEFLYTDEIYKALSALPPAQPEQRWIPVSDMNIVEYIKRSDVLECFHDWVDAYGDFHTPDEMPEYEAIEALPTIELNTDFVAKLTHSEEQ